MQKSRKWLLTLTLAVVAIGAEIIVCKRVPRRSACPICLSYVGNSSFSNNAAVLSGPTFWLTNYTSKTLTVCLSAVEIQNGTGWTKCGSPFQVLSIPPKQGTYATIPFAYEQYPTNAWRLRGTVAEQLSGFAAALAALRSLPLALWSRYRVGLPPVAPMNPFAKGTVWYGNNCEIISDKVLDPKSIR